MTRKNVCTGIAAIAVLAGAGLLAGCANIRRPIHGRPVIGTPNGPDEFVARGRSKLVTP